MNFGLKVALIGFLAISGGVIIGTLQLGALGMFLSGLWGFGISTVILNIGD